MSEPHTAALSDEAAAAWQAATLLIPKANHDANPFFSNAARHLLYGVLLAFMLQAPRRWTLPGAEKNSRRTGGLKMDLLRLRFLDLIH